jgi:NAD(P)-dependent dehydrogenase (short-subunit alcohol dehydrogenase family)
MDYGLEGKVALVTGAASGIGKATAALLAGSGARVVASDLRAGDDVVAADVTDGEAMRAVVAQAVETHGRLDLAANCAGVGGGHAATHEYPEAEFDRIVAINLRGTWLSMRAELEAMLTTGGGAIVNVSSTLGLRGSPFAAPYSASKHGVLGLTKTAALEYAQQGIRVNAVCPGAIDTPMMDETFERFPGFRETLTAYVPMGRMGGPEEVAGAIAWLCSDAASFVTGEALTVEGGLLSR